MASWFAIDFSERAEVFGVSSVFDEEAGDYVEVDPSTIVGPVFKGLPMGRSWSFFICNAISGHVVAAALHFTAPSAAAQLLADGRVAPVLRPGHAVGSVYVDNANVIGVDRHCVQCALEDVLAGFA